MNEFNNWKISKKRQFIGNGAFWEVYRAFLEKEQSINNFKFSQFIYKINKNNSEFELNQNITTYNYIRNISVPTLEFYFLEVIDGINVIIAEDLNANDMIFVSPNNAKNNFNNEKLLNEFHNIKKKEFDENAEETLKKNKIFEIEKFDNLLNKITIDSIELSNHKIGCCEDMFFFGIFKNKKKSEIFYKVADFDTFIIITDYHLKSIKDLVLKNKKTILKSLYEYIELFVDDSVKQNYQCVLNKEIEKINNELEK